MARGCGNCRGFAQTKNIQTNVGTLRTIGRTMEIMNNNLRLIGGTPSVGIRNPSSGGRSGGAILVGLGLAAILGFLLSRK